MMKAVTKSAAKKTPASTDWRSETLARVRTLIKQADPNVVGEAKWRKPSNPQGVPVWSHDGIICTGEDVQGQSEADLRQWCCVGGSLGPFQLQS